MKNPKCECGSNHVNVYKHDVQFIDGQRAIVRFMNCLDCRRQIGKNVEFLPIYLGKPIKEEV